MMVSRRRARFEDCLLDGCVYTPATTRGDPATHSLAVLAHIDPKDVYKCDTHSLLHLCDGLQCILSDTGECLITHVMRSTRTRLGEDAMIGLHELIATISSTASSPTSNNNSNSSGCRKRNRNKKRAAAEGKLVLDRFVPTKRHGGKQQPLGQPRSARSLLSDEQLYEKVVGEFSYAVFSKTVEDAVRGTGRECSERRLSSICQRLHARFMSEFLSSLTKNHVSTSQRYNDCVRRMDETLKLVANDFCSEYNAVRIDQLKQDGLCNNRTGSSYRRDINTLITADLLADECDLLETRYPIEIFAARRQRRLAEMRGKRGDGDGTTVAKSIIGNRNGGRY